MIRKVLRGFALVLFLTLAANVGWLIYGNVQSTEANSFDESVSMVQHQTTNMSIAVAETQATVKQDIASVRDVVTLMDIWEPRFQDAQMAYQKFDSSIMVAEDRAEAYFDAQRLLTAQFNDVEQRSRAEAQDNRDHVLYSEWRGRAHATRDSAKAILNRLEDMDTNLQKLELRSNFAFDAASFADVPIALTELEEDLTQFEIATNNIRAITQSPFEG